MPKDKQMSEDDKFKEYVRKGFEQMDSNLKSFAMNLGSVARGLGMDPKTFVKALYADEKNKAFYMKVLICEQEHAMKSKFPKQNLLTKIKNYVKRQPREQVSQPTEEGRNTEGRDKEAGSAT